MLTWRCAGSCSKILQKRLKRRHVLPSARKTGKEAVLGQRAKNHGNGWLTSTRTQVWTRRKKPFRARVTGNRCKKHQNVYGMEASFTLLGTELHSKETVLNLGIYLLIAGLSNRVLMYVGHLHTYLIIFIRVRSQKSCHRNKKMPLPFNPYTAFLRIRKVEISGVILLLSVTVYLITLLLTNEWNPGEVWFVHVKIHVFI